MKNYAPAFFYVVLNEFTTFAIVNIYKFSNSVRVETPIQVEKVVDKRRNLFATIGCQWTCPRRHNIRCCCFGCDACKHQPRTIVPNLAGEYSANNNFFAIFSECWYEFLASGKICATYNNNQPRESGQKKILANNSILEVVALLFAKIRTTIIYYSVFSSGVDRHEWNGELIFVLVFLVAQSNGVLDRGQQNLCSFLNLRSTQRVEKNWVVWCQNAIVNNVFRCQAIAKPHKSTENTKPNIVLPSQRQRQQQPSSTMPVLDCWKMQKVYFDRVVCVCATELTKYFEFAICTHFVWRRSKSVPVHECERR